MKIKITKEETIEKATPFFTRDDDSYHAFFSEEHQMTVRDYKSYPLIMNMTSGAESCPEITAKEFEDAYVRVSERLNDSFEKGRDKVRESKGITVPENTEE